MEPINIFLFKSAGNTENFGEYLCKKVITAMGYTMNNYSNVRPPDKPLDYIMTGVGGFLNNNIYTLYKLNNAKKWYVWGSGVECEPVKGQELPMDVLKDKCIISMLRGPMTKEFYDIKENILIGDPGFLASYFFKFPEEEKKKVFIEFYYDNAKRKLIDTDINISSLLQPPVDVNFMSVLKAISNASIVVTGSMHIMIAAHSYGVPWAPAYKEHTNLIDEWKWHDITSSIGLDPSDLKLCNSAAEGLEWWDSVKDKIKPITVDYQEQIIKAFPF